MKAFFWLALGVTLLAWASANEQRIAIECMDGGHVWRQPLWFELSGRCTPGAPPRRILLPPLQVEPMPTFVDPTPDPVPPL